MTQSALRSKNAYRLVATGKGGEAISDEVSIVLAVVAPSFTAQPESTSAAVGTQVTLTAEVSNATSYQWQYSRSGGQWTDLSEGSAFVGTKTASLTVTQSALRSKNAYRLVATGEGGEAISDEVIIALAIPAPSFTVQPESTSAAVGTQVTLTAEVSNATSYQWQYSRSGGTWTDLRESAAFVGTKTSSLIVTQSATRAKNAYRLIATGESGEAISDVVTISLVMVLSDVHFEPINSTTCKVVSYSGTASSLTIPETVEGMTVTEIGVEAFMNNTTLVSIDLPDTITVIRARAFKGCTNLSSMS